MSRVIILSPLLNPDSKLNAELIYEDTYNFYVKYPLPPPSSNIFIFTKFAWAESEEMPDEVKV